MRKTLAEEAAVLDAAVKEFWKVVGQETKLFKLLDWLERRLQRFYVSNRNNDINKREKRA